MACKYLSDIYYITVHLPSRCLSKSYLVDHSACGGHVITRYLFTTAAAAAAATTFSFRLTSLIFQKLLQVRPGPYRSFNKEPRCCCCCCCRRSTALTRCKSDESRQISSNAILLGYCWCKTFCKPDAFPVSHPTNSVRALRNDMLLV